MNSEPEYDVSWLFPTCPAEIGSLDQMFMIEQIGYVQRRLEVRAPRHVYRIPEPEIEYPRGRCMRRSIEIKEACLVRNTVRIAVGEPRAIDAFKINKPVGWLVIDVCDHGETLIVVQIRRRAIVADIEKSSSDRSGAIGMDYRTINIARERRLRAAK